MSGLASVIAAYLVSGALLAGYGARLWLGHARQRRRSHGDHR